MEKRGINWVYLVFVTIVFFILLLYDTKNLFIYVIVLIMISLSILMVDKRNIINAGNVFLLYYIYVLAAGPIVLLYEKLYLSYDYYTLILGGLLSFSWGNYLWSTKKKSFKGFKIRTICFNVSRHIIIRLLWIVSVLAGIIYAYKNRSLLFGGDIQNGRLLAMAGNGALLQLSQLPTVLIPMLYTIYVDSRQIYNKRVSSLFEIIFMSVVSFVIIMIQGYRSYAMTFLLCLMMIYVHKKKVKSSKIIFIGICGIAFLEIFGLIRSYISSSTLPMNMSFMYSLRNSLIVNASNLGHVINTFPSKVDYQYGSTYLMNFSLLLPGAGTDFTMWLKEQVGISFAGGGRTSTILGEAYLNFGVAFIFVQMFLMGILGRIISKYSLKHHYSFLAVYLIWQFAHSASGGIANVILPVFIYTFVFVFINMFPILKITPKSNIGTGEVYVR